MARLTLATRLLSFLPAIAWMGVIFWFSSLREPSFSSFAIVDLGIKKAGHVFLYVVLAFALAMAFERWVGQTRYAPWALKLAFGAAVLYAVSDEWHQSFTPTRDPSVVDVGIDAAGAVVGIVAWQVARRIWRAQRRS